MADYRKHWLINAVGERYDFTDKSQFVFLNNPQGFGFNRSYSTIKIGNSELVTSQQYELTDISGEIIFYEDTNGGNYQGYQDFIQFIKYRPLEFHYQTPNEISSYYCDVLITQVEKSEIGRDGTLRTPIVFHRLTEWLNDEDYVITMTNTPTDEGKYYALVRDYHYAGTDLSNTVIYNNGTDDVGFTITIDGAVENPQFALYQYGVMYGICKINGTYDFVMIDSVETSESIYLESSGSAVTNPEQYQDFTVGDGNSYLTWCKLKVGETQFVFTCSDIENFSGVLTIRFKNSYVSV